VGIGNYAFNGWGFDTVLQAGGTSTSLFNVAFTLFGSGVVKAGPGPFAIAGTIGQQTGQTIQVGPGINITRGGQIGFGGTAAAPAHTSAVAHAKKAAAVPTVVKSAAVNSKKAGASAAAGSSRKKK
jgi:hypothetical protein